MASSPIFQPLHYMLHIRPTIHYLPERQDLFLTRGHVTDPGCVALNRAPSAKSMLSLFYVQYAREMDQRPLSRTRRESINNCNLGNHFRLA
jgi:hypothetical protein